MGLPDSLERTMNATLEVAQVLGRTVGQRPFDELPDPLLRVELGSVAREAERVQAPMPAKELPDGRPLVLVAAIPKKHDRSPERLKQVPQELGRQDRIDVLLGMEPGVECQTPAARRHHQGRDGRYLLPVSGTAQNRRLSLGRPGPTDVGKQEEPALVEEDEMGPKSFGFFLYAATDSASSARWLPRLSPVPWSRASGRTSPGRATASRHGKGDNAPQSAAGLHPRSGPGSTGPWRIPQPRHCAREYASAFVSGPASASGDAPKPGRAATHWRLSSGKPATNGIRCSRMNSGLGQRRTATGPSSATLSRAGDAPPTAALFQGVSCPTG